MESQAGATNTCIRTDNKYMYTYRQQIHVYTYRQQIHVYTYRQQIHISMTSQSMFDLFFGIHLFSIN